MFGISITSPVGGPNKPQLIYHGLQHAREWVTGMSAVYIADRLVKTYDTDPVIHSILDHYNIPSHAETGDTMDDLADRVDSNSGVIVALNAETIWGDPMGYLTSGGHADDAVTVTGVARDPETGEVVGF